MQLPWQFIGDLKHTQQMGEIHNKLGPQSSENIRNLQETYEIKWGKMMRGFETTHKDRAIFELP